MSCYSTLLREEKKKDKQRKREKAEQDEESREERERRKLKKKKKEEKRRQATYNPFSFLLILSFKFSRLLGHSIILSIVLPRSNPYLLNLFFRSSSVRRHKASISVGTFVIETGVYKVPLLTPGGRDIIKLLGKKIKWRRRERKGRQGGKGKGKGNGK